MPWECHVDFFAFTYHLCSCYENIYIVLWFLYISIEISETRRWRSRNSESRGRFFLAPKLFCQGRVKWTVWSAPFPIGLFTTILDASFFLHHITNSKPGQIWEESMLHGISRRTLRMIPFIYFYFFVMTRLARLKCKCWLI